jgi:CBS domain-containing protein
MNHGSEVWNARVTLSSMFRGAADLANGHAKIAHSSNVSVIYAFYPFGLRSAFGSEPEEPPMLAHQLMTPNPTTVQDDATVREAIELFHELEVRHLPVVSGSGELTGMLSDRDLRSLALPNFEQGEYLSMVQTALESKVVSLMNSNVISVNSESDVSEIVELMLEHKVGAVPVIDTDGQLVGIVSYIDVLREAQFE